jgi:hypothetical protein
VSGVGGPGGAGVVGTCNVSGGNGVQGSGVIGGFFAGAQVDSNGDYIPNFPAPPAGIWAGVFQGDVYISGDAHVVGQINKGAVLFRIDHPLEPTGKYLKHSAVESPEFKNVYDGIATLDANGEAVVTLHRWFEALNESCRYQLTPIGGSAPGLFVAEEIANNQFRIAGGRADLRVCWQVTGIRHDA